MNYYKLFKLAKDFEEYVYEDDEKQHEYENAVERYDQEWQNREWWDLEKELKELKRQKMEYEADDLEPSFYLLEKIKIIEEALKHKLNRPKGF